MHAVVRTDKMFGTDNRAGLVSVRYQPGDTMTAIDNGNVVKLNGLETGSREVYKGATPSKSDAITDIVLIATPEVLYDETKKNLDEFQNEEGTISRGYYLHANDIFSVTKDALAGAASPAVGNIVELAEGTKLNVAVSATEDSTTVGSIIAVETAGRYTYYVIQVD